MHSISLPRGDLLKTVSLVLSLIPAFVLSNGNNESNKALHEAHNLQERLGEKSLIFAVELVGDLDVIQALLNDGANPNIQDEWGKTALMIASHNRRLDIVTLLLEHGAERTINIRNGLGNTALIEAVYVPTDLETGAFAPYGDEIGKATCNIIELLLKHGADPLVKNKEKKTILDYVTYTHHSSLHHKIGNALIYDREYYKGTTEYPKWAILGYRYRSSTSTESIENKRTILKMLKNHGLN